jgi:hypothetical protein
LDCAINKTAVASDPLFTMAGTYSTKGKKKKKKKKDVSQKKKKVFGKGKKNTRWSARANSSRLASLCVRNRRADTSRNARSISIDTANRTHTQTRYATPRKRRINHRKTISDNIRREIRRCLQARTQTC